MILGLFQVRGTDEPAWFSALGLWSAGRPAGGAVHLGCRGRASRYLSGGLFVVADHPAGNTAADARAVAEAYRLFGQHCVGHLPGRFRFLVHDAKVGRLFAASSTAPPWPLAYWTDSRTTVVCSRVLPILRCPDAPRALDESYLAHLVMGLSAMRDGSTAIHHVRRLSPGEALTVDADGARVSRVDRLAPRDVGSDRERFGQVFIEELGGAVAALAERRPSVLSLSGGLDSAALADAGLRRRDSMAALSFVAPALDPVAETSSIDAMERAWPRLRVTRIDASTASELPELEAELRDDPPLTPLALLPARMRLWSQAREAGFEIVIEGEGGDEIFSMLPTPLDALRHGRVIDAARHVLGSSGRRALVEQGLWLPLLPRIIRRAWLARREPIDAQLPAFAAWGSSNHRVIREAVEQYLTSLVHRPFGVRLDEWLSAPAVVGAALSRRHLAADFGLELEWPMLERGVLETILGLHAARAIRGGPQRPFLRAALAGTVPDEVRLSSKSIRLYKALIPLILTSPRARAAVRDPRVRARLSDLVRFERIEAMLDGVAAGRSVGMTSLWHLECVVTFAEWYARASREHGIV